MGIKLTIRQRLNLEGIIRQQRGADDEELLTNYELLNKVRVPREERMLYVRDTPVGAQTNDRAIEVGPVVDVEFEKAEIRRLQSILKEWRGFGPDDVEWLMPLKAALNGSIQVPEQPK